MVKVQRPSYDSIETKFDELDEYTRISHPHYYNRMGTIAASFYKTQIKTRFIYQILSNYSNDYPSPIVCELGFMAGHSSIIFLESLPTARVFSFDLSEYFWSFSNAYYLKNKYGNRFHYYGGSDSLQTLKVFTSLFSSHLQCNVILIDGAKDPQHRKNDLLMFQKISAPNALLFLDEVNSEECIRGLVAKDHPLCETIEPQTNALTKECYLEFIEQNILSVDTCLRPIPREADGFCTAHFVC